MAPGASCHSRPGYPAFTMIRKAEPMPLEAACFPTSQYPVTVRPHRWWCWPRRISQLLLRDSFDGLLWAEFLLGDPAAPMTGWPPHMFSILFCSMTLLLHHARQITKFLATSMPLLLSVHQELKESGPLHIRWICKILDSWNLQTQSQTS